MKKLIAYIITNSITLYLVSLFLRGMHIGDLTSTILIALVLGVLNSTVKQVLTILSLPITIITFGFFSVVINAIILNIAFGLVPGASIDSFFTSMLAAILFGFINGFIESLFKKK